MIGHARVGIGVTILDDFDPVGNRVEGNVVSGNAVDLGYWVLGGATDVFGNCFTDNTFDTSSPAEIETVMPCPAVAGTIDAPLVPPLNSPDGPKYGDIPAPPAQPTMPGDVTAFAPRPTFVEPSLDLITVPDAP